MLGMQFLGQIVGAHDQHGEAGRGGHDRLGVQHGHRGLEHGPQRGAGRRIGGLEPGHELEHLGGGVHLGHQHGGGAGGGRSGEIVGMPLRADAVDTDDEFLGPVLTGAHRGAHTVAGLGLGVGGHGILEIEDERVGGDALCFLEGTLVGAGHVEHRATGTQVGSHRDSLQNP